MSAMEDLENHILEKYNIIQLLGKGAYGVVYKASDRVTKQLVAIKKVQKTDPRCSMPFIIRLMLRGPTEKWYF